MAFWGGIWGHVWYAGFIFDKSNVRLLSDGEPMESRCMHAAQEPWSTSVANPSFLRSPMDFQSMIGRCDP